MKIQPRLHILHLTDGNRGGSQRHIIDLCRAATPYIRHFVLRIADGAISVHDGARDRALVLEARAAPEGPAAILRMVVAELGIDCVHAHALPTLLVATKAVAPEPAAPPFIVTLHDLTCIDPRLFSAPGTVPRPDADWIARCAPLLLAARAVIAPSAYLARQVRTHYPDVTPVVIPNGIAAASAELPPITPPWPEDTRVFAVVGALGPHKGSATLLRVAAALTSADITGIVIGYTEAQLTPGWLVPGRLYMHGRYHTDELPGLLRGYRARLAYFPNVVPESFSYSLSEAWQAGVPALAPALGALGDRVRAAGAGWLLDDPLDAGAAAAAIERLLGPDGAAELEAAAGKLAAPAAYVPTVTAMRAKVDRVYRAHASPSRCDPDDGWVRLRTLLRPQLLCSVDDCALDAELPALVRAEHALRGWNAKLARDVEVLEESAARIKAESDSRLFQLEDDVQRLKSRNERIEADAAELVARNLELENIAEALRRRNFEVEADMAALKGRNARVEADAVALGRRNVQLEGDVVALTQRVIELDSDVVALKERNTLVEADLVALKQRNTRVEQDAVALLAGLAAAGERLARADIDLAAERARASRLERALAALPSIIRNWLLRDAR